MYTYYALKSIVIIAITFFTNAVQEKKKINIAEKAVNNSQIIFILESAKK